MSNRYSRCPQWLITLPRFYSDNKDYIMAEGLIEELEKVIRFIAWDDKTKSPKQFRSLRAQAATCAESLEIFGVNLRNWDTVKISFLLALGTRQTVRPQNELDYFNPGQINQK
jgi:hypothetical protein